MMLFPSVLLLGNGLNLACGGRSWSGLIDDINVRTDIPSFKESLLPMPMQAILATNNNIKDAMKCKHSEFMGRFAAVEQGELMRSLLSLGFKDILTTNYSYEMEIAAHRRCEMTTREIQRLARCTEGRVEAQYLLHSYNEVEYEGRVSRIWHIHGESRKPNSMILGHYWYASQLARMKELVDSRENRYLQAQKEEKAFACTSWLDSFLLGDVYVLGFGYNIAEIDLWWLLNRKKREKAQTGKLYFYEPASAKEYEKVELLRLMGAEIIDLGYCLDEKNKDETNRIYARFYQDAISDMIDRLSRK